MLGYVIGGAVAAAGVVAAGYHTMAPRSQLYGRTFLGNGRGSRQLALTYDDGPNDPHTLKLLEVLARHEVRVTFFIIGKFAAARPDIVRDVARAGHAIGNHTYNHPRLVFASRRQMEAEIRDCEKAIADALGEELPLTNTRSFDSRAQNRGALAQDDSSRNLRLFRPPYGARRPGVLRVVRAMGYVPVMWSVCGIDWTPQPPEEVEARVQRHVRGGDVILLHDGGHVRMGADRSHTVIATDRLIARYKSEGYEFVSVPEMMSGGRSG
jgi:peptidoglycan/xylan/chitin deacetylase (PgdA/CDA1 family)